MMLLSAMISLLKRNPFVIWIENSLFKRKKKLKIAISDHWKGNTNLLFIHSDALIFLAYLESILVNQLNALSNNFDRHIIFFCWIVIIYWYTTAWKSTFTNNRNLILCLILIEREKNPTSLKSNGYCYINLLEGFVFTERSIISQIFQENILLLMHW